MVNASDKKWFALYVNVRHEKKVMQKLLEKGMEAYVPIVKQMRKWSDRKKLVEIPLFTGYVFVKLLPGEMDKPRWVDGVINYLKFENKPAAIRNEEIEGLRFFVDNGYNIIAQQNKIRPGQKVKFGLAHFKDYIGKVESVDNDKEVLVSFEGIRQNMLIRVSVNALNAID